MSFRMPTSSGVLSPLDDVIFSCPSAISCLFLSRGPSHIARFIIAVVIDAFKSQFWGWTQPHISDEICETVTPALTDVDTSPAIIFERAMVWIMASLNHHSPDRVVFRRAQSVSPRFCLTTARRGRSYSQAANEDVSFSTTDAPTRQIPHAIAAWGLSKHYPVPNDCSRFNYSDEYMLRLGVSHRTLL